MVTNGKLSKTLPVRKNVVENIPNSISRVEEVLSFGLQATTTYYPWCISLHNN